VGRVKRRATSRSSAMLSWKRITSERNLNSRMSNDALCWCYAVGPHLADRTTCHIINKQSSTFAIFLRCLSPFSVLPCARSNPFAGNNFLPRLSPQMSSVASADPSSAIATHLRALKDAPTAPDAKAAADLLARSVKRAGPSSIK
jgi:hypothetical protein